ncbi:head-to-tail adaptor [Mycobacterium Phage Rosmarinus]|uniref:Head-to-tail adaptor n=10 Tax=Anayavirus TaxID=2946797 RepID=G1BPL8_9CAUD|nr:head-to-tail adaptor [Mycobacterium phage CrimD]YP_009018993.1 head-to-tail adaptor [Mycobacterium phage BarrelRoll]YP_009952254.1 head-to-tail adaptor [Mycobacterium phage Adephagia]YP_009952706.1 head-to-tail adaptor [Mycobacterium phage Beezoo]YP_009953801.1 head-to-tail adaptor [Mycobacterium phage Prithvi]YP_009954291.1 head-to-tail adaptor [Mycobacterium phage Zavala]AID59113.1 head-to-tail adaptor [Mycobacterium phage Emerson]AOQ29072.1 head-to-tail adaptor [Mycobacterium phage Hed
MLASLDDVKAALRAMGKPELAEALAAEDVTDLLQEATDLVTGHLWPGEVPSPTPPTITRVTASVAATALTKPKELLPETESLQADGFGVKFTPGAGSPGCYLTAAQKTRLRPWKRSAVSVPMSSERYP